MKHSRYWYIVEYLKEYIENISRMVSNVDRRNRFITRMLQDWDLPPDEMAKLQDVLDAIHYVAPQ